MVEEEEEEEVIEDPTELNRNSKDSFLRINLLKGNKYLII